MRSKQDIPGDILVELVDMMFTRLRLIVTVGIAVVIVSATIAISTHDMVTALIGIMAAMVVSVRVTISLAYRRRRKTPLSESDARIWQNRYAAGGWTLSILIGALAAWTCLRSAPEYQVLTTMLLIASTSGVIVRVAVRPWVAIPQFAMPLIILTVACLLHGGVIYMMDGLMQATFLVAGIEMIQSLHATILERLLSRRELARRARHDDLTGLPNRAFLGEKLAEVFEGLRQGQTGLTVLLLDLDGFKEINDTFGHAAGDEILRVASNRMLRAVDDTDFLARLGGDEFALLRIARPDDGDARALAEKLIAVVQEPYQIDGHSVTMGVSIGISTATGSRIEPEELLHRADRALYAAKAAGRGCFRTADQVIERPNTPQAAA